MKTFLPYAPALRWKGAEIAAVLDLPDELRRSIQPLFEFVPRDFGVALQERTLALKARQLAENWGWTYPFSIDFSLLEPALGAAAIPLFDKHAAGLLKAIITINPMWVGEPRSLRELALVQQRGFAIRLSALDLRQAGWQRKLESLVKQAGLANTAVDLIVDYRAIESAPGNYAAVVAAVRAVGDWRSVTLLAGAFPEDLSGLPKNDQHLLPRTDWLAWRDFVLAGGDARYGDYTIQHGIFREHEGKGMNFSASIRYTGEADWVIMRGESVRSEMGYEQWPANAELLCARREFRGPTFSAGDLYIKTMASQTIETGGAKSWLTAGINHHLAMVAHQLQDVAATPARSAAENEGAPDWPAHF
jgi:hypothetical protein